MIANKRAGYNKVPQRNFLRLMRGHSAEDTDELLRFVANRLPKKTRRRRPPTLAVIKQHLDQRQLTPNKDVEVWDGEYEARMSEVEGRLNDKYVGSAHTTEGEEEED